MPTRPWWLWLASASFIAYYLLVTISVHHARAGYGFVAEPAPQGASVARALAGAAAERAGLTDGDQLVMVNGWRLNGPFAVTVLSAAYPTGVPVEWVVERAGARRTVIVEPLVRRWVRPSMMSAVVGFALLLSLALGLLVAYRGNGRPTTLLAAWLLVSMGCASLPVWPRSMAFDWARLPLPLGLLMFPAAISAMAVPNLMFTFCAIVPRPVLSTRWLVIAQIPIALIVIYIAVTTALVVYAPGLAMGVPLPGWLQIAGPLAYGVYVVAAASLLRVALGRVEDVTERRRVRTLLAGAAAGGIGLLILGVGFAWPRQSTQTLMTTGGVIFSLMPVAFAYATLRHRLFDLRVIVRLGLQYALARGLIAALIPVTVLALVADATLHGDQTLQQILASRGWTYAVVAAIVGAVYVKRAGWMTAIDRRFFRERYAAQQILREVVQDVSTATDVAAAAAKVVGRINSALHPITVAVLTKPRSASTFQTLTALPATHSVPSLPAGSPITQIVRALGRPVAFGSGGLAEVPDDQRRWLTASAIEVVVPIATDPSRDEALLALGPRRSEEPYSKEDLDLLAAIGTSLGLLMQRTPPAEMPTIAAQGGAPAQKIGHRYRIERPIGEGGMGIVYAALDETLDRAVAIKVIKDQHLLGADGLSRFQREARTAASLSHPNIVTVHDYGVDEAGSPYLVMELLDGQSLRAAIRSEGRMPPARALPILAGLAAAVEAAHAKGVIHRDLKPENVFLIARSTHVKILDYGIAKAVTATTTHATTGGVLGTLPYMAPEQAAGGIASPAWDIWSLSVIAFEMLSGAHPFGGGLPVAPAIPIRTLAPELDDRIAAAIDRALTLDPATRPQHAISAILRS